MRGGTVFGKQIQLNDKQIQPKYSFICSFSEMNLIVIYVVPKGLCVNGTPCCVRSSPTKQLWVQVLLKTCKVRQLVVVYCEIVKCRSKKSYIYSFQPLFITKIIRIVFQVFFGLSSLIVGLVYFQVSPLMFRSSLGSSQDCYVSVFS